MDFPTKETYINYLYDSKGNNIGKLEVTEGTIKEYNEFMKLDSKEQINKISNILLNSYKYTLFDKILTFFKQSYVPKGLLRLQKELLKKKDKKNNWFDYYVQDIVKKKFGAKSIYDGVNLVLPDSKGGKRRGFSGNSIKQICKEWGVEPQELINNYTVKQYSYMQDSIIYEGFEMDDKTKINNDRALKSESNDGITTEDIKARLPKRK